MESPPLSTFTHTPKIYMAGKMGNPNFRNTLGLGPRDMAHFAKEHTFHGWEYMYVGPIVPSCDHGCWHNICSGDVYYECGTIRFEEEYRFVEPSGCASVVAANLSQIRYADMLFAWFDSFDAYGSIAEIGYAAALDIPIYIGFRDDVFPESDLYSNEDCWESVKTTLPGQELWYIGQIAEKAMLASTPKQAFLRALRLYTQKETATWKKLMHNKGILFPGKISR